MYNSGRFPSTGGSGSASVRLARMLLGAVVFACVLLYTRFEAFRLIGTHYFGGARRDAALYIWLVRLHVRRLGEWIHGVVPFELNAVFDTPAFFPYRWTLAWSDNFLLPGAAAFVLEQGGVSPTASYNAIILGAVFLNGFCTFLCALELRASFFPAIAAGLAMMTFPYLTLHLGHPQLQFFFWIPIAVIAVSRASKRPTFACGSFLGLALVGAFLTSVYIAVFAALAACVFSAFAIASSKGRGTEIRNFAFGAAVGFAPIIPFARPYLDIQSTFGPRGIHEFFYLSASPWSYFASPDLLVSALRETSSWSRSEALLSPGIGVTTVTLLGVYFGMRDFGGRAIAVLIGALFAAALAVTIPGDEIPSARIILAVCSWIAIAAVLNAARRGGWKIGEPAVAELCTITVLAFILSLGPLALPHRGERVFAPFAAFYELFPGFSGIRAVGRIGILAVFAGVTAAAVRFSAAYPKRSAVVGAILSIAIVFENRVSTYALEDAPPPPAIVEGIPSATGAAIFLPLAGNQRKVENWGEVAERSMNYLNWSLDRSVSLINGYSGQRTKLFEELVRETARFPDAESLDLLRSVFGLRWIVVLAGDLTPAASDRIRTEYPKHPDDLRFVSSDAAGNLLFELLPRPLNIPRRIPVILSSACRSVTGTIRAGDGGEKVVITIALDHGDGRRQPVIGTVTIEAGETKSPFSLILPVETTISRPYRLVFKLPSRIEGAVSLETVQCP